MSKFLSDNIEVEMTIGGQEWYLIEAKAELSRNRTPNFVRIKKMAPKEGVYFDKPQDLLGNSFSLSVENEIDTFRQPPGKYDSTIFEGNVANITAVGTGVYEGVIYDPSQQALNSGAVGSVMNQKITLQNPEVGYDELTDAELKYASIESETIFPPEAVVFKASEALNKLLEKTGLEEANDSFDKDIQLSDTGKVVGGERGQFRGAIDVFVMFNKSELTVKKVLSKLAKETKSFWWFDRTGTFHFGVPDANVHTPELITDSSAGITTPPYQSVKVIGSDVASQSGYGASRQNPDEPIIVGGDITIGENAEPQLVKDGEIEYGEDPDLQEPTFVYRSREIITEKQARNALDKIAQDLGEQYANGKLTVVGYPSIKLFDVVILPHANAEKKNRGNYNPRLPMGGSIFSVYKVVHKFNPSDGFVTQVHVAGMTGPASVIVAPEDFAQETAPREDVEEEGATIDEIEQPAEVEAVEEQAQAGAASFLVEQGFLGSKAEAREIAEEQDISVVELAEERREEQQTNVDDATTYEEPNTTEDGTPVCGLDEDYGDTSSEEDSGGILSSVGEAIDNVLGGESQQINDEPYSPNYTASGDNQDDGTTAAERYQDNVIDTGDN